MEKERKFKEKEEGDAEILSEIEKRKEKSIKGWKKKRNISDFKKNNQTGTW